jgi:hypothetical protein
LFFDAGKELTYIKADVEGHEIELLEGGIKTISKWKPKIAIATYHCSEHAAWITSYLKRIDSGYRVFTKGIRPENGNPTMLHAWLGWQRV